MNTRGLIGQYLMLTYTFKKLENAEFAAHASFDSVMFNASVDFRNVLFSDTASFLEAEFHGKPTLRV